MNSMNQNLMLLIKRAHGLVVNSDLEKHRQSQDSIGAFWGNTKEVTYTEFQILRLLAANRKKIFSLENIYQSIWNDNAVGNDAIMVHIKNLRKKLGDNSRSPLYIKTAWGKGYYID